MPRAANCRRFGRLQAIEFATPVASNRSLGRPGLGSSVVKAS